MNLCSSSIWRKKTSKIAQWNGHNLHKWPAIWVFLVSIWCFNSFNSYWMFRSKSKWIQNSKYVSCSFVNFQLYKLRIKSFWVCPSRKWPVRQIRHCQFCNQQISKNQNYFYSGGFLPFNESIKATPPDTPVSKSIDHVFNSFIS